MDIMKLLEEDEDDTWHSGADVEAFTAALKDSTSASQPSESDGGVGIARKFGMNSGMPHTKIARSISVKDVISVLEKEPQMCKSTFLYCLYERVPSGADAPAE